jgi:hypothetical protein
MIAFLLALTLAQAAPIPVRIFVGHKTVTSAEGFVEPVPKATLDSVADVKRSLKKFRGITLLSSPDGADVLLLVSGRREEPIERGTYAMPVGNAALAVPVRDSIAVLGVEMRVGTYTKDLIGAKSTWNKSADAVVNECAEWINVNLNQILAARR